MQLTQHKILEVGGPYLHRRTQVVEFEKHPRQNERVETNEKKSCSNETIHIDDVRLTDV